MKICQILAGNEDGGLEKHTIDLSHNLALKGYSVTVIAHPDFKPLFPNITFVPMDLTKSRYNFFILFKLFKIISYAKVDIVHAQANKATAMLSILKHFLGVKSVATLHNYKNNLRPFYDMDFVITVSNKIGEKLHMRNKKTIYNGIDFSKSTKSINLFTHFGIDRNCFIVCSVARFTHVKRFDILIKALSFTKNIHLILVGDGPKRNTLEQLAQNLHLKERITFTGNLKNEEVKEIINAAQLFAMCSDREGFPYTFIEAMLCETPFVSTPVSDISHFIDNRYIVPFDNPQALAETLQYVQYNYTTTQKEFQNVFIKAKKTFTLEHMVNEVIAVYHKVLS